MKQILYLLILISVTLLSAQFGTLHEVYEGDRLSIEKSNTIICKGDTIFTCINEGTRAKFGLSIDNGDTFNFTELVSFQNEMVYVSITDSEIAVLSDNTIIIIGNSYDSMVVYTSYDLGETFEHQLFDNIKKNRISQVNDDIYLITENSLSRAVDVDVTNIETIINDEGVNPYFETYNGLNEDYLKQWNKLTQTTENKRDWDESYNVAEEFGRRIVSDSADIAFVKLEGEVYQGYEGNIQFFGYDTLNVYSWYPANAEQVQMAVDSNINWYEDSNIIAQNVIPKYETVWTEISGEISNNDIFYIEGDLWIEGEVKGNQSWYANGNLRLLGDIFLSHTENGENPDGQYVVDDSLYYFERPINGTDYIKLNTNIIGTIAYKHLDPESGLVINNNSNSAGGINIYGVIWCLAMGEAGNEAGDGHFTFEYQHPHGSTPDFTAPSPYTGNDTTYTMVDLHKYIMEYDNLMLPELQGFEIHGNNPINGLTCGYPFESDAYLNSIPNTENYVYPYGTDYPWYNPVWPESADDIVFDRGTIRLQGSLGQRRRGFVWRSGADPYNHQNNVWDLDNHLYDGEHSSLGYSKDYSYDYRYLDFEYWSNLGVNSEVNTYNIYKFSNEEWTSSNIVEMNNYLRTNRDEIMLASNESLTIALKRNKEFVNYFIFDQELEILAEGEIPGFNNEIISIKLTENNKCYILSKSYDLSSDEFQIIIHDFDVYENTLDQIFTEVFPYQQEFDTELEIDQNGKPILAYYKEDEGIYFKYNFNESEFNDEYIWSPEFYDMPTSISLIQSNHGEFKLLLSDGISFGTSKLQFAEGSLELTDNEEIELPNPVMSMSNYPNPFNPSTEIRFQVSDLSTQNSAEIEIYNIKGQRVREFKMENVKCKMNKITWNGTDQNNHAVASGIYYYTLKLDGKVEASRKMVLLK